jgi:hypothetical protein
MPLTDAEARHWAKFVADSAETVNTDRPLLNGGNWSHKLSRAILAVERERQEQAARIRELEDRLAAYQGLVDGLTSGGEQPS